MKERKERKKEKKRNRITFFCVCGFGGFSGVEVLFDDKVTQRIHLTVYKTRVLIWKGFLLLHVVQLSPPLPNNHGKKIITDEEF